MKDQDGQGVLFLCVANSSRSQMAEGFARTMAPKGIEIASAGSAPTRLNPLAVKVMAEVAIDISGQKAKSLHSIELDRIGHVITLCLEQVCPTFPRAVRQDHWSIEDPAAVAGSEEEKLRAFRRVRDQIRKRLEAHFRNNRAG